MSHEALKAQVEGAHWHARILQRALRRAWQLFQDSGVMREPDGRTGNAGLDDLGSHLDEWASEARADDLCRAELVARGVEPARAEHVVSLLSVSAHGRSLEPDEVAALLEGATAYAADGATLVCPWCWCELTGPGGTPLSLAEADHDYPCAAAAWTRARRKAPE